MTNVGNIETDSASIEWQMTNRIDQLLDKVPHFKKNSFKFKTSQIKVKEQEFSVLQVLLLTAQDLM